MTTPATETDRFAAFVRATYDDLMLYAMRRVGPSAAEDLVSETYAVAWRRWIDPAPLDPRPWLFGIARNLVRNEIRRVHRSERFSRTRRPIHPVPSVASSSLGRAFATLSESDQEILRLVAWDGLATSQLAAVLGIRPGAVATRLSRARARLEKALEET